MVSSVTENLKDIKWHDVERLNIPAESDENLLITVCDKWVSLISICVIKSEMDGQTLTLNAVITQTTLRSFWALRTAYILVSVYANSIQRFV
jgi:hypothetical protein